VKSGEPKKSSEKQSDSKALWLTRDTLSKALALGGCVICRAVHAAERKGIHSFLYEGMMFPLVRQKFLHGGGFCLRHFWMAKEMTKAINHLYSEAARGASACRTWSQGGSPGLLQF
jgi:hypothetical protein